MRTPFLQMLQRPAPSWKHRLSFGFWLLTVVIAASAQTAGRPASPVSPAGDPSNAAANEAKAVVPYRLELQNYWQMDSPGGRFDASALLWTAQGELLTVNDRGPEVFQIRFGARSNVAEVVLKPDYFSEPQLRALTPLKHDRYDAEGLAQDEQGRIYMCEEADRWVMRLDPKTGLVEKLPIDWSPVKQYFNATDPNASFEGIAVGEGKLYVANERSRCRIIEVDLQSLKVTGDFMVKPANSQAADFDYTDLCYVERSLWILLRGSRTVLRFDPRTQQLLAQFDFGHLEMRADLAYLTSFATGAMEGLAVTSDSIWLVADNNGLARIRFPKDHRPILMKCPRPDRALK